MLSENSNPPDETDLLRLRENIATSIHRLNRRGRPAQDENIQFHKLTSKAANNHLLSILLEALILMLRSSTARLAMIPSKEKA